MVRNIVVIGGSSHPELTATICTHLGLPPAKILLGKFAVGETRVEIGESVREKDVFIIQSGGGGKVNDHLMELFITISACKTASARRVTAVLPLFAYSRQSDIPYDKAGSPLKLGNLHRSSQHFTFESRPETPAPGRQESAGLANGTASIDEQLRDLSMKSPSTPHGRNSLVQHYSKQRGDSGDSTRNDFSPTTNGFHTSEPSPISPNGLSLRNTTPNPIKFEPQRGYRIWVAQAGRLVADLLTCAGADHVITMDLHDPQYQGFFDIPVDNLYGRHVLTKHIRYNVPNYKESVIVSPDAGGAKRATAIADELEMPFALIHKERRPTQITDRQNATMMLVGDVRDRVVVLVDDLADTCNTLTRAAKLLKKEGATKVIAIVTHGILSGEAIDRVNYSSLDQLVVTNSVDQTEHLKTCKKLQVLDVGFMFAEAIRRIHHGESISSLFKYE